MIGAELVAELKRKLSLETDSDLAKHQGVPVFAVRKWKQSIKPLTPRQTGNIVEKASSAAVVKAQTFALRPIIDFFSTRRSCFCRWCEI